MQCGSCPGGQYSKTPQIRYSATSASITSGASSQVGRFGESDGGTSADAMGSDSLPSRITFVASPMSGSRFTHVEARDAMR
eukprot:2596286-Rhodomonas_salina.1